MRFSRLLTLCIMSFAFSLPASAQDNADGMTLLGMAEFSELRRPYYIAAFYSDAPSSDADLILETNGRRRMEIRVTSNRWSPRRFSQQWTQAVLINNSQDQLLKFDDNFVQFNTLLDEPFLRGDIIVIDSFQDGSSSISVNGSKAFDVSRPGFLELLLSKWIGARPPSTEFKNSILGGVDAVLESSFVALQPDAARQQKTQRWFAGSVGGVQQNIPAAPVAPPAPVVAQPEIVEPEPEPVVAEQAVPEPETEIAPVSEVAAQLAPAVEPEPEPEEIAIDPEVYKQQQETLSFLYQSSVAKRILKNVRYPKRAVKRDQQDTFQVVVVVDREGNVVSKTFVKESRYGLLNKAALEAIEAAGNMPPVPPSLDGDSVEVIVPFTFRLQ